MAPSALQKLEATLRAKISYSHTVTNQTIEELKDPDTEALQNHSMSLKRLLSEIQSLYRKIDDLGLDREQPIEWYRQKDDVLNRMEMSSRKIDEVLIGPSDRNTSPASKPNKHKRAPLQSMKLVSFAGDVTLWRPFWDNFSAMVDSSSDYSDIEKLSYLRGQLEGRAATLVANYDTTSANYKIVVDLLKERFDHPEKNIQKIIQEWDSLKRPGHNLKDLVEFQTVSESIVRRLGTLNCDMKGAEWLTVAFFYNKVTSETKEAIRQRTNREADSWKTFRKGLLLIIGTLEEGERADAAAARAMQTSKREVSVPKTTPREARQYGKKLDRNKRWQKGDVGNYSVSAKTGDVRGSSMETQAYPGSRRACVMCGGPHSMYHCTKYVTAAARTKRAKELERCTRCCGRHST